MNKRRAMCVRASASALLVLALMSTAPAGFAAVTVRDDAGNTVTLPSPARRIITLSPHATELVFAAGAGSALIAASDFSDYPPQARRLPSIGGPAATDSERIVALKPDLVVAWASGNAPALLAKLRQLRVPVFESEPRDYASIAANIERLARLAGTEAGGERAAADFRARWNNLEQRYRGRAPVRVFFQIWHRPLMTVNSRHLISRALRLCGGENVFGDLPQLAPTIGIEAVLQANPEVIIAHGSDRDARLEWQRFAGLTAVAGANVFTLDPDLTTRPGPRILDGTEALCRHLDIARKKRP